MKGKLHTSFEQEIKLVLKNPILLTFLLAATPVVTAGVRIPPPEPIYMEKSITADGSDIEWANIEPDFNINYNDIGVELSIQEFVNKFYYNYVPSQIIDQKVTGYLFKIDGTETFKLGEKLSLVVKFKDLASGELLTRTSCSTKQYSNGRRVKKCTTVDLKNQLDLYRDKKTGKLRYKYDSDGFHVEYGSKLINGTEFFEIYTSDGNFFTHENLKLGTYKPVVIVTAQNELSDKAGVGRMQRSFNNSPWSSYSSRHIYDIQPGAEAYLRDIPDVRPVVQVGVSAQLHRTDFNLAVSSDFRNLTLSYDAGATLINTDREIEIFVNAFATDDLNKVTTGRTTTVAGDIGLPGPLINKINVGAQVIYDDEDLAFGAGLSFGVGLPDSDVSVNYGNILFTTEEELSPAKVVAAVLKRQKKESGSDKKERIHRENRREGRTSRVRGEGGRSIEN
ncbi:hypothetical protein [Vibrio atypicus]|uniref:hypothetical protein n=1 Tax=Vibrio atypicus TaxID=558271 RepID=UPI00135AC118|nr:hypothetical protein [Vibrio atypicus]